jgi:uncharacterized membrane protein YdbT with pleckstrin-like domain
MSTYVERVLQPGEQVRYVAAIHWITYAPGLIVLLIALLFWYVARSVSTEGWQITLLVVSGAFGVVAVYLLFRAWFDRWITEIAVTDRRVIFKTGFIRRDTKEMQMDKIESVEVQQSIPGRMLDYGDVIIKGTGHGVFTRIKTIAAPLDMRNQITGV